MACFSSFRQAALFAALMLAVVLSGCAGRLAGESYVRNPLLEQWAVAAIAKDAVVKLASIYPPGHTRIELVYPVDQNDKRVEDAFSATLEDGLRKYGFTISPQANLRLAWTLDALPEEKEEAIDPLFQKEDNAGAAIERVKRGKKKKRGKKNPEKIIPAEPAPVRITPKGPAWYLRLKLADTDRFELRTLTRVYSADGLPMAGFAESQN